MQEIEHYLYDNNKNIFYPKNTNKHNSINLERNDTNIKISINDVSIDVPREKFDKILTNLGGVFTVDKKQVKVKKLKTSSNIDITIRDENNNFASSIIYSPHFNTSDWHQFRHFIEGYEPLMILTIGNEYKDRDKNIEQDIGFGIYPYDFSNKNLNGIYTKESRGLVGYEKQIVDHYSFSFNFKNNISEHKEKIINSIISSIEEYLEISDKPIIVQNLEEIQNILNIDLPKDRLYNFDDLIPYEEFESSRKHYLGKDLCIYGGNIHQNALTYSLLYFDKEIIKNPENKLDKLVKINEEIKSLEPILHFDI